MLDFLYHDLKGKFSGKVPDWVKDMSAQFAQFPISSETLQMEAQQKVKQLQAAPEILQLQAPTQQPMLTAAPEQLMLAEGQTTTEGNTTPPQMTPAQVEQEVQEGIQTNAKMNPKGLQKAIIDGVMALENIETRMQRQSRNINHQGIDTSQAHNAYVNYFFEGGDLNTSAQTIAAGIRDVIATGKLKAADVEKLTGAVMELVGDVELAQAYVDTVMGMEDDGIIPIDDGTVEKVDEEGESGYNAREDVKLARSPISKRQQYMGKTPSKTSQTGNAVITRMGSEGKVIDSEAGILFQASDNSWYPIKEADMAHIVDAVTWWNEVGRKYGARSKEVLQFMHDPYNYYLEHYSINRSEGAKLRKTYLPPLKEK